MNGLVPADNASPGMLSPLTSGTGTFGERLRAFAAQPPVRKVLPLFAGTAGLGLLALTAAPPGLEKNQSSRIAAFAIRDV